MDVTTLLSTATLLLMSLCILLAFFLWTVNSQNRLSNRLLGSMLLTISISISVFWYGFYFDYHLGWDRVRDDINIISSPLLFLYIVSCIRSGFRLKWIHLLHLIPFALIMLLMTPRFYLVDEAQRAIFLNNYYTYPEVKIISVIRWLTPVIYISWTYIELYRSRQLMLENYSDDRLLLLKWLWQLNTLNLTIFLISSIKSFLRFQMDNSSFHFVRLTMVVVLISFLVWIVMKALYHPKLFRGIDFAIPSVSKLLAQSEEQTIDKEKQATIDRILQYMQQEKPYLDASLSLQKLARQLSLPSYELSLLINHHLGKHFFDFVNEYRIRAAQQILIDPAQKAKTVLEILYEVGFNSKSSFNTAFKKHTDMTPTEYRKGKRV